MAAAAIDACHHLPIIIVIVLFARGTSAQRASTCKQIKCDLKNCILTSL